MGSSLLRDHTSICAGTKEKAVCYQGWRFVFLSWLEVCKYDFNELALLNCAVNFSLMSKKAMSNRVLI